MPVAILTGIDPVLRDVLVADLLMDLPGAVELRYRVDADDGALRRTVIGPTGVHEDVLVELDHPCVSCAMREDALPALDRLAREPGVSAVLLSPPLTAEPAVVAGTLVAGQGRWHLASAVCVVAADTARHDLLDDETLAERGLGWAEEDQRAVGEALAAQIEYSDLVVLESTRPEDDECAAARELVEHLRDGDQMLLGSVHAVDPSLVVGGRLDHGTGLRRRDPRAVHPHGGPTVHGTWTLDLVSDRPFHPDRLLAHIERLGAGRLRSRGRFWVPDRPSTVCQWDGAGGQVSVGPHSDAGRALPTTRLVITGVDPADPARVREAFAASLLTPEEWADGLAPWMGREDPLAPWLGARGAGSRRAG